ncbi:MAG: hypothetical protein HY069_04085 [Chlamydiia bacterium]|nr:hypothetical protein [Chlamydiia bacterium]
MTTIGDAIASVLTTPTAANNADQGKMGKAQIVKVVAVAGGTILLSIVAAKLSVLAGVGLAWGLYETARVAHNVQREYYQASTKPAGEELKQKLTTWAPCARFLSKYISTDAIKKYL